jgi:hypothetical protein
MLLLFAQACSSLVEVKYLVVCSSFHLGVLNIQELWSSLMFIFSLTQTYFSSFFILDSLLLKVFSGYWNLAA